MFLELEQSCSPGFYSRSAGARLYIILYMYHISIIYLEIHTHIYILENFTIVSANDSFTIYAIYNKHDFSS